MLRWETIFVCPGLARFANTFQIAGLLRSGHIGLRAEVPLSDLIAYDASNLLQSAAFACTALCCEVRSQSITASLRCGRHSASPATCMSRAPAWNFLLLYSALLQRCHVAMCCSVLAPQDTPHCMQVTCAVARLMQDAPS